MENLGFESGPIYAITWEYDAICGAMADERGCRCVLASFELGTQRPVCTAERGPPTEADAAAEVMWARVRCE